MLEIKNYQSAGIGIIKTYIEPKMRIELTTYALRVRCSTPELPGRVFSY